MQLQNKVIMACAGSGKTWGLCQDALNSSSRDKKVLMVSFTNKGVESLKREYEKQNFGVIDQHIKVHSWYQFLLKDLIKPYQSYFLGDINIIKSFDFSNMYGVRDFSKKNTLPYFLNKNGDVKANKASEFAIYLNIKSNGSVIKRLEEIYSCIYIDELQDLTGRDIDLLELLFKSSIRVYCVGDYKQSTLKTHNAKANKKRSGEYIFSYLETLKDSHNLQIVKSNESRRFIQDIADFANLIYPEEPIKSVKEASLDYMGVYQITKNDIEDYIRTFQPSVLRFDKRTSTHGYTALNFGVSKGMTMDRVVIYPNGPLKNFLKGISKTLKNPHKYFVGVTRPQYSLVFVVDKLSENEYFKNTVMKIGNKSLDVTKFHM
ncbi:UvrD-helicase domain-containing protein [Paraliobacillus ryukyuensis]|uniref:UvrD-helicase domain-containing protein n=1 Tax=Paraliobacillus ryukyuensis TaxID=200904 RepID=UPI0009A6CB99|nr:UvrD-helicase domain-containing protein [Paraliobacillus ryukyuensis]